MDAAMQLVGQVHNIGKRRVNVSKYLGEGGFSFVYLATDEISREQLVLKRMHSQTPEMETLVHNEIKMMEGLKHPKIVQYLGHSSSRCSKGIEYFVLMEFCSGTDLASLSSLPPLIHSD